MKNDICKLQEELKIKIASIGGKKDNPRWMNSSNGDYNIRDSISYLSNDNEKEDKEI